MSYLRGSSNYVWCTTDVLGKGATGAVFRGVSKHDGEPVAVKTFNQLSHMRPQEVQIREFDVLKKVKHENIVKLLAIEEEQDGRGKVIVMELCTGGSLFNILDDPENTYGLPEDEFLLVLEHLAAGIKHLRDKNLVHRDLKPGNIMKFIAEDGRTIYKLTDFGAARELEEDGEFMSLYGTEEYLHPDMYERAVLRKSGGKTYSAFVDLWSIGVTLFHVATGTLPFRPYGGRKNKEMMYYIVTKKESGVISGSQLIENGDIEWKRDLPSSTQLSAGLKLQLTPILAGLMEVDPRKRWSFETFFNSVTALLSRRRVHVFYVNKVESLRVYLDEAEHKTVTNFQCLLMEQTDISPEHQIILFKGSSICSLAGDGEKLSSEIPSTSDGQPLILCHREINSVSMDWSTKDLAKFPAFPNLVNVENDATLGKQNCAVGHAHRRRIEKICRSVSLIGQAVTTIVQAVANDLTLVSKDSAQVQSVISSLSQQLGMMTQFQRSSAAFLSFVFSVMASQHNSAQYPENNEKLLTHQGKVNGMGQSVESLQDEFRTITAHLFTLEQPIKKLFNQLVENGDLLNEWESATQDIMDISRSSIRAGTHVTKLRESWQRLLHNRATRSLTYNDEQFHILERIKMQEKAKGLTLLLNEECQLAIVRMTEVLSDWYKRAKAAFIQTEILVKDMAQFEENLHLFLAQLTETVENYQTDLEGINIGLKQFQHTFSSGLDGGNGGTRRSDMRVGSNQTSLDTGFQPETSREEKRGNEVRNGSGNSAKFLSRKEYVRTFNRGLNELTNVQEEVWTILKENAELVNQFQTLTFSLLTPPESDSFDHSGKGSSLSSIKSCDDEDD